MSFFTHHLVTFTECNGEQEYDHHELLVVKEGVDAHAAAFDWIAQNGEVEDDLVWIDGCRAQKVANTQSISEAEYRVMRSYLPVIPHPSTRIAA
jgi:hypothetical protein